MLVACRYRINLPLELHRFELSKVDMTRVYLSTKGLIFNIRKEGHSSRRCLMIKGIEQLSQNGTGRQVSMSETGMSNT